jgi:thiol-disulfide isomerase/thioredoxin
MILTKQLIFAAAAVVLISGAVHICTAQTASITVQVGGTPKTTPTPTPPSTRKVTQVDIDGFKKLLKPNARPLLINFWATWCPPCVSEFPDLVRMHQEFRDRMDFITVSFDEMSDIDTYVPKFLDDMHSEMPAYLLHTPNENAAIALVSRDWSGNLPMTVLYDATGKQVYTRMGKIRADVVRENIIRVLSPEPEGIPVPPIPAPKP